MSRYRFFPDPPLGHPGCLTLAWERYRAEIRTAAERWCDEPTTVGDDEYACGDCQACEGNEIISRGEA